MGNYVARARAYGSAARAYDKPFLKRSEEQLGNVVIICGVKYAVYGLIYERGARSGKYKGLDVYSEYVLKYL